MAKKSLYVCKECGQEFSGWLGRCSACGAWNSMEEVPQSRSKQKSKSHGRGTWLEADYPDKEAKTVLLNQLKVEHSERQKTGITELDQVLGQGFVKGSVVLLGGNPGIGKSTLAMQALGSFPPQDTLYISGEESAEQLHLRAERLGLADEPIRLLTITDYDAIEDALVRLRPELAVIDSIQTVYSSELSSAPGSVSQITEVTMGLLRIAKSLGITLILTGHVTKQGSVAGPRVLEHMVDVVMYFEGEKDSAIRLLRAAKNRFGATDELGIFEMTENGLISLSDTSNFLFSGRPRHTPGSVTTASMEGSRPLLLEIQALTVPSNYGTPVRMTQGIDRSRLSQLLAIMTKAVSVDLSLYDTYVNVTGGIRLRETAADLAILAAVLSSFRDEAVHMDAVILGEVGLTGEVRPVTQIAKRVEASVRAGWRKIVLPAAGRKQLERNINEQKLKAKLYYVNTVAEAFDLLFSGKKRN